MLQIIFGLLSDTTTVTDDPSSISYLTGIAALIVALSTAAGFVWTIRRNKKEDKLNDDKQAVVTRSVTFDEMEAAIPGLGSLVDRWQTQAETAWKEIERLRASEEVDRAKIASLEDQVRALQTELIVEKKKNMRLEERISELEGKKA